MGENLRYVNLASAQGLEGDVADLFRSLEYANFREARFIGGDIAAAGSTPTQNMNPAPAGCSLRELNLHNARPGPDQFQLNGFLQRNTPPLTQGILTNCANLRWIDVGNAFRTGTNFRVDPPQPWDNLNSVQAGSQWDAETEDACVHMGRRTA